MKALINKSKVLDFKKENTSRIKSENNISVDYDANNIEFIGTRTETSGGIFGDQEKELFIFKIKESGILSEFSDQNAEAFLVIACK